MEALSPRPTIRSPQVIRAAAEALAPEVAAWAEEEVNEEVISGLEKALRYDQDGYELARALERSWLISPDAELVEILDSASSYLWDAERKAVIEWVMQNGVTVDLELETIVETPHGVGPIRGRNEKEATYTVYIEENAKGIPGTYIGSIYAAEKCKVVGAA